MIHNHGLECRARGSQPASDVDVGRGTAADPPLTKDDGGLLRQANGRTNGELRSVRSHIAASSAPSAAHLNAMAEFFGMLAGSSRLALLEALRDRPMTVNELVDACSMKQPHVSQQLSILHRNHMVRRKREGSSMRYELADPNVLACCSMAEQKVRQDAKEAALLMLEE